MEFENISKIISNPSWDIIVLFAFVAVGFFYGISAGKGRLLSFLFSLYVGGFLFENFSYLNNLTKGQGIVEIFVYRVIAFLVILLALNFLFSRILSFHSSGEKKWWQVFLLSFLNSGLLFSYIFHLFPAKEIFEFSPVVQNVFASNDIFFWWLTVPLVALFIIRR